MSNYICFHARLCPRLSPGHFVLLTSSLWDGFSSKAPVLLSEKLLRSQSRKDVFRRGDSAGSEYLLPCIWHGTQKALDHETPGVCCLPPAQQSPFPSQSLCFLAYKTCNVTEGMRCLNSSISFGSALGCSWERQSREQGRSKMEETKSDAGNT